jgi:chromosome segregation ATPase
MADISGNTVVEMTQNSQSQYRKYRYSIRLAHWKTRQDYLVKNITKCKEQIAKHKKKIDQYEAKLFEYESYMIVLNPLGEQLEQVKSDAANRLQEAIQEVEEEDSDHESVMSDDGTDAQSVATCDTLVEMREQVARRMGRR